MNESRTDKPHEDAAQRFRTEAWPLLPSLLRVAKLLCRDEHAAEDLVQETMMRAFRHIQSFQPQTNMKAWLLTIMRRLHIDSHRSSQRQIPASSLSAMAQDPPASDSTDRLWSNPEQLLERFENEDLEAALRALPDAMMWTLLLVDVEGMSVSVAASILETAEGTIKSRASRARAMLREVLLPQAIRRGWVQPSPELKP